MVPEYTKEQIDEINDVVRKVVKIPRRRKHDNAIGTNHDRRLRTRRREDVRPYTPI